jgi:hypothetical protein
MFHLNDLSFIAEATS